MQIKLGDWYDKEGKDRKVATQYHEVMGNITYRWLGRFSRLVIIIALGGDALAQIIASSSNFHTFIPSVNKRCAIALDTPPPPLQSWAPKGPHPTRCPLHAHNTM